MRQSNDIVLAMSLYAGNDEYDNIFLSNYADLYLVDALQRIDGVSEARIAENVAMPCVCGLTRIG